MLAASLGYSNRHRHPLFFTSLLRAELLHVTSTQDTKQEQVCCYECRVVQEVSRRKNPRLPFRIRPGQPFRPSRSAVRLHPGPAVGQECQCSWRLWKRDINREGERERESTSGIRRTSRATCFVMPSQQQGSWQNYKLHQYKFKFDVDIFYFSFVAEFKEQRGSSAAVLRVVGQSGAFIVHMASTSYTSCLCRWCVQQCTKYYGVLDTGI